jgi:hypothetical protein
VLGRENRRIANAVSFCATGSPPNIRFGLIGSLQA